jgi:catechol 2,3-dioxygenase-like lactoylglutathione lyase family enzyme
VSKLLGAIPALPVKRVDESIGFYNERLGFETVHREGGFAVLRRDEAVIHLWEAGDEAWRERSDWSRPVCSGAESFIAGTASCRVEAQGVADLYPPARNAGIVHPRAELGDTDFGTTEFAVLDPDGNLVTFFERRQPESD